MTGSSKGGGEEQDPESQLDYKLTGDGPTEGGKESTLRSEKTSLGGPRPQIDPDEFRYALG